ncbi:ESF2/ABP1 family protein [Blastomyces parvus]|uniref:Pre-rRNA-processing protein ESF2 n=1 Tax=Blastomyces parvus TaxID=2060905 RepID=A0A2B7X194_9EURO|nr:ESF2/ABP1 family protein [Blastomyces parvus]
MTVRKRNEYLDIESSNGEESDGGYDSEAAQEAKGKGKGKAKVTGRATKRRKLSVSASESASEDEGGVGIVNRGGSKGRRDAELLSAEGSSEDEVIDNADTDGEEEDADGGKYEEGGEEEEEGYQEYDSQSDQKPAPTTSSSAPTTKSKPLKPKETRKKNKTGVIYFSSLPPYLKPSALKSLLTQRGFSPITKIFLSPYVPPNGSSSTTAKRASSNRRRTYTDGWVEFASKRTAKICAETLNATIVGGKKGGWYHDDVLNIKYLKGFKWADLMEQVQRERAEREARKRIEDARARREEKAFLAGVERGKVVEGIRRKRAEKAKGKEVEGGKVAGGNADGAGAGAEKQTGLNAKVDLDVRRVFRQNEALGGAKAKDRREKALDADAKRVLGKIF